MAIPMKNLISWSLLSSSPRSVLRDTVVNSCLTFRAPDFLVDGQKVIRDIVLGPITRERALEAFKKTGMSKN